MKNIFTMFFCFSAVLLFAQDHDRDIDEQVWKPFTKAIMTQDVEAFMALHSKDVIRVERNSKQIFGKETYQMNAADNWPKWKESLQKNNIQYAFELRFLERITNGDIAYQVGYFKNESMMPSGQKRVSYGKFHVVLKKEGGRWKILVDSDSDLNGTITEEMFLAASPLS